jgi:hypothetical protein
LNYLLVTFYNCNKHYDDNVEELIVIICLFSGGLLRN